VEFRQALLSSVAVLWVGYKSLVLPPLAAGGLRAGHGRGTVDF